MAKTYNYLPHDVAELLRAIVATVNDNLVSETSLSIPRVTYKAETWKELCNRLKADSESSTRKATRYPMVALIRDYDYTTQDDSNYTDVSLKLIIVTQTTFDKLSEDRQAENYQPILYPIRSELMEQIALSRYFHGPYNPWPAHKCAESFNLSKDNNNGALSLPDYVDALIITDLRLKINQQMVAGFSYGVDMTLVYLNNVNELSITASENQITVWLVGVRYVDTLSVGHPAYVVLTPNGNGSGDYVETSITVGAQVAITFGEGYPDGEYVGYIQCDDGVTISMLKFFYKISDGAVTQYTSSCVYTLEEFSLGGLDYPDYPFQVSVTTVTNKAIISRVDMSSDGGNELFTQNFTPLVATTGSIESTQYLEAPTTSYRDVICQVALNGSETEILLDSISYYKLKNN